MDAQNWSGLTRLREVLDGYVRASDLPQRRGRELFDLPDAPRPDPDTPAPLRFLYDYDNLLLGHADRSRVISETYFEQHFPMDGPMPSIVLVDGMTSGTWKVTRARGSATLTIKPFTPYSGETCEALTTEEGLLQQAAPRRRPRGPFG